MPPQSKLQVNRSKSIIVQLGSNLTKKSPKLTDTYRQ